MKLSRKIISILLCLLLCMGMMPAEIFAEENTGELSEAEETYEACWTGTQYSYCEWYWAAPDECNIMTVYIDEGLFPEGISLGYDGSTLVIAGTPTQAGTYDGVLHIDTEEDTYYLSLTIEIEPGAKSEEYCSAELQGQVGQTLNSWEWSTTNGEDIISVNVESGSLPKGLSIPTPDLNTFLIDGTPMVAGTTSCTIYVETYYHIYHIDLKSTIIAAEEPEETETVYTSDIYSYTGLIKELAMAEGYDCTDLFICGDIEIPAGESITIPQNTNVYMDVSKGADLKIYGTLIVADHGSLYANANPGVVVEAGGTLSNDGYLDCTDGRVAVADGGTLINNGSASGQISVSADATVTGLVDISQRTNDSLKVYDVDEFSEALNWAASQNFSGLAIYLCSRVEIPQDQVVELPANVSVYGYSAYTTETLVVNGSLTIDEGALLCTNGCIFTIKGSLNNNGTIDATDGPIQIMTGAEYITGETGAVVDGSEIKMNSAAYAASLDELRALIAAAPEGETYPIFISGEVIIPEGETLTVPADVNIYLSMENGTALDVAGTLIIEAGAYVCTNYSTMKIEDNGVVRNYGTFDSTDKAVYVSSYGRFLNCDGGESVSGSLFNGDGAVLTSTNGVVDSGSCGTIYYASGGCATCATWELNEECCLTIRGSGIGYYEQGLDYWSGYSEINIPWNEYRNVIRSVQINKGIEYISAYAFKNCTKLKELILPDGVTEIGYNALYGCTNLTHVVIPESVTTMENNILSGCTGLTSAGPIGSNACIEYGWTSEIPEYAFQGLSKLTSIKISDGIEKIGENAFASTGIQNILLPSSLKEIDTCAFKGCYGLSLVIFAGNPPTIASDAFLYTNEITACYPADDAAWNSNVFQNYGGDITWLSYESGGVMASGTCGSNLNWRLTMDGVLTISGTGAMTNYTSYTVQEDGNYNLVYTTPWYDYRKLITDVSLPDGITNIGNMAFYGCTNLVNINLPASLQTIGSSAFKGCVALNNLTLPDELKRINSNAFMECTGLTEMIFPESLVYIGSYAFYDCSGLKHIVLQGQLSTGGSEMFSGCAFRTAGPIGGGYDYEFGWTETVPCYAFEGCSRLQTVVLPDGVTRIAKYAFDGCSSLQTVNLPASLTQICEGAFDSCRSLTGVTIPDVTSIGEFAFQYCINLQEVTLPDSLESLSYNVFNGCSNLQQVHLGANISKIQTGAFQDCVNLSEINLPAALTDIGNDAFCNCGMLNQLTFTGNAPKMDEDAFTAVLADVTVPAYDITWTEDVMQNYGGVLTWSTYSVSAEECTEHFSQLHDAVEASCTKTGYTGDTVCIYCGTTLQAGEVIPALGHSYGTEPAYRWNEDGTACSLIFTCSCCGYAKTVKGTVNSTIEQDPTCTEPGVKTCTVKASFNGDYYARSVTRAIPAVGHTWGEWTINKTNGERTHTCSVCGTTETGIQGDVDADGNVNLKDLLVLKRAILDCDISEFTLAGADLNDDGVINKQDLLVLKNKLAANAN